MAKDQIDQPQGGFTLLELAIVLVVVGLILGGVMAASSLIKESGLQKTIRGIGQVQSALQTFEAKYRCLPGDCDNATQQGLGGVNGNGDGLISADAATSYEQQNVWVHLGNARLIPGSYTPSGTFPSEGSYQFLPGHAGYYLPFSVDNMNFLGLYQDGGIANAQLGPFTTADAFAIDRKIDDGLPGSRSSCDQDKVCGSGSFSSPGPNAWQTKSVASLYGAVSCVDDSVTPWRYNLANQNASITMFSSQGSAPCSLVIRLQDKL